MRRQVLSLVLILATAALLIGQETARTRLERGIAAFESERYRLALDAFGSVLADPQAVNERPDALYWTAIASIAIADNPAAERAIATFLTSFPGNAHTPDLLYQKGRILHGKGDFQAALISFSTFMSMAPNNDLYPSALYWSGECLYSLGRLDEARRAFSVVVDKYPSSVKMEAASFKRDLIGLEFREEELLRLLTWSHEESLRAIEDFRRKERAYEQAISVYQKQIADSRRGASSDAERELSDLRAQVADLSKKLGVAEADLASARSELDAARSLAAKAQLDASIAAQRVQAGDKSSQTAPGTSVQSQASLSAEALAAKARALDLLSYYLTRLSGGGIK